MFKLFLEKAEEPEIKLPTSARSWKKQESSRKTSIADLISVIVLAEIAAILVLQAEQVNPDANIVTGQDAVWWVFVSITTVGFGDRYPTTALGRLIGVMVMFCGIALIGVLTSF